LSYSVSFGSIDTEGYNLEQTLKQVHFSTGDA